MLIVNNKTLPTIIKTIFCLLEFINWGKIHNQVKIKRSTCPYSVLSSFNIGIFTRTAHSLPTHWRHSWAHSTITVTMLSIRFVKIVNLCFYWWQVFSFNLLYWYIQQNLKQRIPLFNNMYKFSNMGNIIVGVILVINHNQSYLLATYRESALTQFRSMNKVRS